MMAEQRIINGMIYEKTPQGIVLVGPAGAPPSEISATPLPVSPKQIAAQAKQEADAARADRREARMADSADVANDLKKAELELKRQQLERDGNTAAKVSEWRGNLGNIKLLENTVKALRHQYDESFRGKGLQSIAEEFMPARFAPEYGVFEATAQSMLADMAKAKGLTAQQFNTPVEQRMFFEPLIPKRGDTDEVIEQKLANLEAMIATGRATTEANLGMSGGDAQPEEQRDETPLTAGTTGGGAPQQTVAQGTGPLGLGGGTRRVSNDRANAMVNSLVNAGASEATVNAALKQMGLPPAPLGSVQAARAWMEANPGKRYDAANIYQDVPLSLGERIAGSPVGAGLANYANSATAGTASALAGERGKGALDAMTAMNPGASLTGSLLGGVTGALGAEVALAARAPAWMARFAPRIADAAYGGLSGFNAADDGEGLTGAATGATAGALGGVIGDRAMRAAGATFRGVTDPAVQRLRDAGIPLTFGRAVGQSGTIGAGIKKLEEAATSLPGVGSMIGARFDDGLQGLNRAAFEIGAETTGGQVQDVGSAGLGQLRQLVGDSYDTALNPGVRLDVTDPQVAQDIINSQMAASSIPQVGANAVDAIDYRITGGTGPDGTMDGRDFQEAYRGLGRDGREAARSGPYAHEYQGVMGQAQDVLAQGLEAQNPGAYAGFVDANTANRRAMVLADAVNAAKNQPDELFTPAQLNTADANSATRLTGRLNSASGERPFHLLGQDAQQVMGNRLPNSGTADRAWTGLALGGLAGGGAGYAAGDTQTGASTGLAASAALMLGGTRAGQRILTELLLERPAWSRTLGDTIQRNAYLGGGLGSGVLTPLVVGQ